MPEAPTEEEIAMANEILTRRSESQKAERQAVLQPVLDIVYSESFGQVHAALLNLDGSLAMNPEVGAHIMAARAGLMGLSRLTNEFPAPESDAVELPSTGEENGG